MFSFQSSVERRLPIYLIVDTSESMVGEPLQAVNEGIRQLIGDLSDDPMAVETAYLSIVTFSAKARQIMPLREILKITAPQLTVGPGTSLGAGFELLAEAIKRDIRKTTAEQKGDYRPIVFLMTDGMPTDDWKKGVEAFRRVVGNNGANVIALGCGEDADLAVLKAITPNVLLMKDVSRGGFREYFKWVSASVATASVSASGAGGGARLPSPPGVLEVVGIVSASVPSAPVQHIFAVRCRDTGKGYLMRYRRLAPGSDRYKAQGAYKVDDDYFAVADMVPKGQALDAGKLEGAPACPYCGRTGWRLKADKNGLECHDRVEISGGRAQVMFVLDVTGSMAGEINGVRENIADFVGFIQKEGLSAEVGLIAFRDLEMREPPEVLKFGSSPFTTDTELFMKMVRALSASGGGGNPGESSFDALALAARQPFSQGVTRVLVLITDEPPLLPDGELRSIDDVVGRIRKGQIDQLHMVVPKSLFRHYQVLNTTVKGGLIELPPDGRGGESFRKLLLNLGRSIAVTARAG